MVYCFMETKECGGLGLRRGASFLVWPASLNSCWTPDGLARRGLDRPDKCLLCDQEPENIQHLLVSCVFSRDAWFRVLSMAGMQQLTSSRSRLLLTEGAEDIFGGI